MYWVYSGGGGGVWTVFCSRLILLALHVDRKQVESKSYRTAKERGKRVREIIDDYSLQAYTLTVQK